MNIYEKLQSVRVEIQQSNLKKTGENKFAGYKYYELSDFLPKAMELFKQHGLFSLVSFTTENASLKVINAEKPEEELVINSPMGSANLKGCHEIQNIGAVQTYQRRYLYMAVLELTENDALDATTGSPETKNTKGNNSQKKANSEKPDPHKEASFDMYNRAKELGFSDDELKKYMKDWHQVETTKNMTIQQLNEFKEQLINLKQEGKTNE